MTSNGSAVRVILCAWLLAGAVAAQAQAPARLDIVLVHGFMIPNGESWGTVSINLSAGGWHVGDPSGLLATEPQLRLVLRSLVAAEVGGRCTGWVSGATAYPCGFSVRDIDLAGAVEPRYAAIAVDQESVAGARERAEVDASRDEQASAVPRSPRLDTERFVGLRMPSSYLGNQSRTFGGTLRFEIRALSNVLAPSMFDRSSGLVILRARLSGERS